MKYCYSSSFTKITRFILLCFLCGIAPAFSQSYIFDVDVIGVKDGLPNRNTYAIVQDKEGFIWVSTIGAVSRYDGYRFKTYNTSFLNISESGSAYLAIDKANRLWYCEAYSTPAYSGVINTRKDTVYTMDTVSDGLFTSADVLYLANSMTNPDDIFITTRSGSVYKYNGVFEEIYRFPKPVSSVVLCETAPDGSYWIIYNNNAISVKNGKALKTIPFNTKYPFIQGAKRIVAVYPRLILEIYNDKAERYLELEKDTFAPFSIKGHRPEDIRGLFQLHEDYSVYTTKDTLFIRDSSGTVLCASDAFEFFMFNQNLGYDRPFLDRQNILWVPTEGGLLKIGARKTPFEILEPGNSIRSIFKDDEHLWIGGYKRNVVRDITSGTQEEFAPFPTVVMSFFKDLHGHLWIGTSSRYLKEYIPEEHRYEDYVFDVKNSTYLPFQNAVTKNYWIGDQNGLFRFDVPHKKITPFPLPGASKGPDIRQIYQNAQGIWIASNKGIFLMDAGKEVILKHYTKTDGLPANNINHIYEDKNGIFWIGTKGGGLLRWDVANNSFRQYTVRDGLSNNTVYAVYEDDYETLWLPSDYGLMAFDKNTATTRVYLPENGIAHEEFNTFAHFEAEDGTLYFGGLNGVTKFHPGELKHEYHTSPPLYVAGVRVLEEGKEEFTDKTPVYLESGNINLNSGDRILELELTLLDYEKSDENQYAYTLTGRQEQWIYTNDNKISIISPPYGRYELVVKARGASGSWSGNVLTISVYKPLPFYRRRWFILIFLLAITIAVMTIVRWRVRKLEKARKHLEEEVQKRTYQIEQDKKTIEVQAEELKALDQAKTRFFANITHEFRTPLTLIIGPAEQIAASNIHKSLRPKIRSIKNNAARLLELVNQLLDISRLEGSQMEVKAATTDIVAFTRGLVKNFQPLARGKQQQLTFTSSLKKWETHFDTEKFSKILYNLLSNAVKYTPEKGAVELLLFKKETGHKEQIEIRVKDTGIGIDPAILPYIFNRFYQVDDSSTRNNEGTGIGLALVKELVELQQGKIMVESEPEKGSVFTVMLPVLSPPLHPDAGFETLQSAIPETEAFSAEEQADDDIPEEDKLELLIIEDNAGMRAYIRSCINASVYTIREAADGEEGIAKAKEIVPDLIISDVMMPKKDGFEVTRAIRSSLATSHIPVILLTAKASQESRLEGLERGADAYLTKPFSPKELNLRIKKLIELRRLLQRRYQNPVLSKQYAVFQKEDRFITDLKSYITEHISDPGLNGEFISRHFSMSRMQLYRKLKALMNSDISNYVRSIRLDMAVRLLKEKQLNIAEIAYETGFSSPDHFSRTFKKVYGKPPSKI